MMRHSRFGAGAGLRWSERDGRRACRMESVGIEPADASEPPANYLNRPINVARFMHYVFQIRCTFTFLPLTCWF